jgi:hypothetical protein
MALSRRSLTFGLGATALAATLPAVAPTHAMAQPPAATEPPPPAAKKELEPREKAFQEMLADSVLDGRFTIVGAPERGGLTDKYSIGEVAKVGPDRWIVTARIQYGKNDVKFPVPVIVEWAGDTPVLIVKDVTIPGLGTFNTRLLFYQNQYAGVWQHDSVGGQMYGAVTKPKPDGEGKAEPPPASERKN